MPTAETHPQTQWRTLFLQLILYLQEDFPEECGPGRPDANTKEVVIELNSGGFVYSLTRSPAIGEGGRVSLSNREKEIIRLVCGGLPNKAISDVLEISPWTVATYLKRIFAKLAVGSRAEMVARVLREGLLEASESYEQ